MVTFAGFWNLDGRPADPAHLSRIAAALGARNRAGEGKAAETQIDGAFCVSARAEDESPLLNEGRRWLAFDGRLDNREPLIGELGADPTESDSRLVLRAYERWRENCVERLLGDFAFALFDGAARELFLARDPLGVRPMYYRATSGFVAFGSRIRAVLAHPALEARPSFEGLADAMLLVPTPLEGLDRTCFEGVLSLPPSHILRVSADRLERHRYWDFDPARKIELRNFSEYSEAFGEIFSRAVARRCRSPYPIAVSVSGGLDSSSILCQALSLGMKACGVSYIADDGSMADERNYLAEIEKRYGCAITRIPLAGHASLVGTMAEQIDAIEAPMPDYLWGVTCALHEQARRSGARVLLTGHWGDQFLFSQGYLVDLFASLRWPAIANHLHEYGRWFAGDSVRGYRAQFVKSVLRQSVPDACVPVLRRIRRALAGWTDRDAGYFGPLKGAAGALSAGQPELPEGFHSAHARGLYIEARSKYHVQCMEWNHKAAGAHGLTAAFPFLDRDLIAFLMATPGEIHNHDGVPRAILREGLSGVLPDAIARRNWKADFTAVVNQEVDHDFERIVAELGDGAELVAAGVVDARRFKQAIREYARRKPDGSRQDDCLAAWKLADLYALEVWLRSFGKGKNRHAQGEIRQHRENRRAQARQEAVSDA